MHLLISWLQSPSAVILEPKKIKSVTVSIISPSICHEGVGPDAMIFVFWMLSFKPTFSFSSFTFIKRLFSYSSLSAIRVVSSAYLRLLIFLPGILIPACASSSPAFRMIYSAYKLNQGNNIQPCQEKKRESGKKRRREREAKREKEGKDKCIIVLRHFLRIGLGFSARVWEEVSTG